MEGDILLCFHGLKIISIDIYMVDIRTNIQYNPNLHGRYSEQISNNIHIYIVDIQNMYPILPIFTWLIFRTNIQYYPFWRERVAFQRSAFGRSTAGNDVVATIFIRFFFFFLPLFPPFFSRFLRRDLFS